MKSPGLEIVLQLLVIIDLPYDEYQGHWHGIAQERINVKQYTYGLKVEK